jgi:hypothetical protein
MRATYFGRKCLLTHRGRNIVFSFSRRCILANVPTIDNFFAVLGRLFVLIVADDVESI